MKKQDKEFNLSEKIEDIFKDTELTGFQAQVTKDVKEAVRKLKEELSRNPLHPLAIVDKIFGDKLI